VRSQKWAQLLRMSAIASSESESSASGSHSIVVSSGVRGGKGGSSARAGVKVFRV
jgi:hypothetical protein